MFTVSPSLVVLALFVVWMLGGLLTSIQDRLGDAKRLGRSRVLAVLAGAAAALPFDWIALGVIALVALAWSAA